MKTTTQLLILTLFLMSTQAFAEPNTESFSNSESFFSKNQKFDTDGIELYSSNLDLKRHKKIGFGVSMGGAGGLLGLNTELNLDPSEALLIGLGTGPSYGTFSLLWKHNFEANYLSPYMKFGYSKWFSSTSVNNPAKNSDVLRRLFSEKDLNAGRFGADFLVSTAGVEYNQLEGDLSGVNFYGELVMLLEAQKTTAILSGAVGMTYFY